MGIEEAEDNSVGTKAASGLQWSMAASGVGLLVQLTYTIFMSRLLTPRDFGLLAAALVSMRFIDIWSTFGIINTVVQKPELDLLDKRAAFTLAVASGALGTAIVVGLSPLIAAVFDDSDLILITSVLGSTLLLRNSGAVAFGTLRRELKFRAVAIVELSSQLLYLVLGVTLAWLGLGVWSLVIATIVQSASWLALSFAASPHSLRPLLDKERMRTIGGFGGGIAAISILEFLGTTVDTFAVGRWTDSSSLGQYSRATTLIEMPLGRTVIAVQSVLLPAQSRVQNDTAKLQSASRSAFYGIVGLLIPLGAGAAAASPDLIRVALGSGWEPAADILPFATMALCLNFLNMPMGSALEAMGKLQTKFIVEIVRLTSLVLAIGVVVLTDPTAIRLAIAWIAGETVRHITYMVVAGPLVYGSWSKILKGWSDGLILGLAAAAPFLVTVRVLDLPALIGLALGAIGAVAGLAGVFFLYSNLGLRSALEETKILDRMNLGRGKKEKATTSLD